MKPILGLVLGGACLAATGLAADPAPRLLGAAELDAVAAGADASAVVIAFATGASVTDTDTSVAATVGSRTPVAGIERTSAASAAKGSAFSADGGPNGVATGASASTPEGNVAPLSVTLGGGVSAGSRSVGASAAYSSSRVIPSL